MKSLKNIKKSNNINLNPLIRAGENNVFNIEKMCEIMGNHYDNLKRQVGLKDVFDESESDEENQKVF